jgi:general secretion pathway protein C
MKTALGILNIILLTAASYFGVHAFYTVVGGRIDTVVPAASLTRASANPTGNTFQPLSHYQTITTRNLFKVKKVAAKIPDQINLEDLEETDLKLKLWGTVAGQDQIAYAVIEDLTKREQNLFRSGDSIQDATVKMIIRERVILTRNGKDEVLQMEEVKTTSTPARVAGPSGSPRAPRAIRPRTVKLKRDIIDEAISDIGSLMDQAKIRPHFKDGEPDGLSISGIRANSIFRKMGLRNGDVLVGVGDQSIESVDDALEFYTNMKSESDVSLRIKRRGREQVFNYKIE